MDGYIAVVAGARWDLSYFRTGPQQVPSEVLRGRRIQNHGSGQIRGDQELARVEGVVSALPVVVRPPRHDCLTVLERRVHVVCDALAVTGARLLEEPGVVADGPHSLP